MIALILAHPHIFWLSLGGLLLAAEMLGGNGYLLWSGIAGVVTGLLVWMLPLSWEWQGTLFAVLTLLAARCGRAGCVTALSARSRRTLSLISAGSSCLAAALRWKRRWLTAADTSAWATVHGRSLPMTTSRRAARLKWSPSKASPYI